MGDPLFNHEYEEARIERGLLKPTLQITFFSIIGVIVIFFTQVILAAKFGAKMEMDSYLAASVVPQFITAVFLSALNVTFIPIFIKYETKKNKDEAWRVASITINITFVILLAMSFLGFILAPRLISLTAPGFKGESFLLTVYLVRIILPSIIFSGLNSILSSIYYAHHKFFKPSIAPVINSIFIFSFVILFEPFWGIKSVAFGTLVGSIVSFSVLIPIFLKRGRYMLSFDFSNEGVIQIIKVMSPLVFAGLFYRATTLIERMIASTLPEGSISYLGYSNRIITTLVMITVSGISVAIFPLMSKAWAENDLATVREYFAKGVRIIMLIAFPIAVIFTVLNVPIIQIFLERGRFDHTTTLAVANVVLIELVIFVCGGLGGVIGKGFYIAQKTWLLAFLGITQTLIYIGYAYILARHFSFIGLAVASSMYSFFPIIINTWIMRRLYNGINGKKILDGFIKVSGASLICMLIIHLSNGLTPSQNLVANTAMAGLIGALSYLLLITYFFKMDEAVELKAKIFRRCFNIVPIKTNTKHY